MIYLLLGLVLLAVLLTVIVMRLILDRIGHEYKDANPVRSMTGIDIETGTEVCQEIQGHHGFEDETGVLHRKRAVVRVYLENCATRHSYCAELPGNIVIGRMVMGHPECNTLPVSGSLTVSRQHCRLFLHPNGGIYAENLSQTKAAKLNGRALDTPKRIQIGDYIGLGDIQLRVADIAMQNGRKRRHR